MDLTFEISKAEAKKINKGLERLERLERLFYSKTTRENKDFAYHLIFTDFEIAMESKEMFGGQDEYFLGLPHAVWSIFGKELDELERELWGAIETIAALLAFDYEAEHFDEMSKQIAANERLRVGIRANASWLSTHLVKAQRIKDEKKAAIALVKYFQKDFGIC